MVSGKKSVIKIIFVVITVSVILTSLFSNVIISQRQKEVREMANKILLSAEYYVVGQMMDGTIEDIIIYFPDNEILNIKGKLPTNGYLKLTSDGKIEILYHYNGYCISKSPDEVDNSFEKSNKEECLGN